ncbi:alpha-N-acetylglucosaminidase [Streptomyces sp. NPDC054887]
MRHHPFWAAISAVTALVVTGSSFVPSAVAAPATAPSAADAVTVASPAAQSALTRLLPAHHGQFTLSQVTSPASGDYFTVSGTAGAIRIEGTTPAVILGGVNHYLKHTAKVDIGWPGTSTSKLPATLPAPSAPVRKDATVPHRFALNDTDDGYSGPYRNWADFEKQIDLLALHGVNEVFVQMGAEAAYYDAFQEFGYSSAELEEWIPGPAHQPWWLMQNMYAFAGPVSKELIDKRAALGRKIVDRLNELGMKPVLPGYYGTVPPNFTTKNPSAKVVPQGSWVGFARPDWLDPRNAMFSQVAEAFYRHQKTRFGSATMFKMDLLHEGGQSGDVPVGDAAKSVMTQLQAARPGATWVLIGWLDNPQTAILDAVDKSKLFIVDGLSDRYSAGPTVDREVSWKGTPYAFGTINNFGGHTSLGANTGVWLDRFEKARTKSGSALKGIAYLPEGTGTNPAAFELFTELAWTAGPVDQEKWFADYATQRYGGYDPHAAKAWDLLRAGPYSLPAGVWSEPQDSLFTARPDLAATTAARWSPEFMRYDAATVQQALAELLQVAPALRNSDAYRFDLVDVARQALSNRSRSLLPQIKAAYGSKDLIAFRSRAREWKDDMALLDRLLSTDTRFLLGPWLEDAKAWGATDAAKTKLEFDARSILTTWGHRSGSEAGYLRDYANREWSGLVSGFYAKRWAKYLDSLDVALSSGAAPASIDWFASDDDWNRQRDVYATTAAGDSYDQAAAVLAALPPVGRTLTGVGGKCVDVTNGSTIDGTALQLYTCNGTAAQSWSLSSDGSAKALGKCMDARNGATANGTVVQLYVCNGTVAQQWIHRDDRTLQNVKSGRCLDAEAGSTANGTRLLLWDCHSGTNQKWTHGS